MAIQDQNIVWALMNPSVEGLPEIFECLVERQPCFPALVTTNKSCMEEAIIVKRNSEIKGVWTDAMEKDGDVLNYSVNTPGGPFLS